MEEVLSLKRNKSEKNIYTIRNIDKIENIKTAIKRVWTFDEMLQSSLLIKTSFQILTSFVLARKDKVINIHRLSKPERCLPRTALLSFSH